jgi:FO synthase
MDERNLYLNSSHAAADVNLRFRLLCDDPVNLLSEARTMRDAGHGKIQSYSPKIFIPLTRLCRDYCHYCTFSRPLERGERAYLTADEVLAIAREGAAQGCTEALFTLGDKPELRHPAARTALDAMGQASTISYLADMCALVVKETGLLPHVNAGALNRDELALLRSVSASQGLMLESTSLRLCAKGGPHFRSPDKLPAARIETIRCAGELSIPFTSGILIGIGEAREERLDALFVLRDLHAQYGHIQEIIIQNFRAKARTPMASAAEPDMDDLLWTIAAARLILGPQMNIQAPPNLSSDSFPRLIQAGINDWGGISPVTPDHVNPEAPWPDLENLYAGTRSNERILVRRLPVYPGWNDSHWIAPEILPLVLRHSDAHGWGREDGWHAGNVNKAITASSRAELRDASRLHSNRTTQENNQVKQLIEIGSLDQSAIETLFSARGDDVDIICQAADDLRRKASGEAVGYVVNRNINYTNICAYSCGFCAFSKGKTHDDLRGSPYDLDHSEIARRVQEAAARGASEICLQGGIHPSYTGQTYLDILRTSKTAVPDIHVHAFSPLEITHGAHTLGISVRSFLEQLKAAGLGSLPGTAAEILSDDVRDIICPDKLNSAQWLNVIETAHDVGLPTTATIMFGHVDTPAHWAKHLLAIRDLQIRTGGITEFVPLPFVHMEAPLFHKGQTRAGPTFREVRLMHAISRLVLHPYITNIQASWTKLGPDGVAIILKDGANDLGGTLMNESISRAAGAGHGQELAPHKMEELIRAAGRTPRPRNTLYGDADNRQMQRAKQAAPLSTVILTKPSKRSAKPALESAT